MVDEETPENAMGRAIAGAEERRAIADGDVHNHRYDGTGHPDCPRCLKVGIEHPQPVDGPVDGEVPDLRDAVGDVPERPAGVRGALDRLMDPERASARVRASRRRGVGALLPPLSGTGIEALGEVPAGYKPGGYIVDPAEEAVARAMEARLRVRLYLEELAMFYGDETPDDVIDTVDGSTLGITLRLSDLRTLVGLPNPEED